ncbi:putative HTH-type transcriptional regulator [Longimycelium tulufanense]|uniref:Putative HTH-type transcriptional regulator n=1 Tax=Longimycelium tulufanense TaxID=907463 RepID=A0A8J3CFL4_9PSEU|nr:putative HTH-type transcriptional regulator [Longimycelium tulufanense]
MARLLDATIETIVEVGYYRTTVQAVCVRAGLSAGAMFRQFDSRLALIAASADEVSRRLLDLFGSAVDRLTREADPLLAALEFLREAASSPLTDVWRELMIAARTDAELLDRIREPIARFYDGIYASAEQAGLLDQIPPPAREVTLYSMVHMFSGEAMTRVVYPRPDLEPQRLRLAHQVALDPPEV